MFVFQHYDNLNGIAISATVTARIKTH